MDGPGRLTDESVDLFRCLAIGSGIDFSAPKCVEWFLTDDIPDHFKACSKCVPVFLLAQKIPVYCNVIRRIRGFQLYMAAALRM